MINGGGGTLPGIIQLHNPEAYEIWTLWRALDRRFLPSQIMAEPQSWLDDMLTLDGIYETLKERAK
jgi:hypothetical protein